MPTVPILNRTVTQSLGTENKVTQTAPEAAFGGGKTQEAVFNAANDFAKKIKDDADYASVLEAERKLNEFETKFLYDPENGAFLKQGKDAFDLPKQLNEQWEKLNSEVASGLSSAEQRAAYSQRAQTRKAQLDRGVLRHVGTQIEEYQDGQAKAMLESEQQSAILNYQEPARVNESIGKQTEVLMKFADRKGLPPEVARLQIEKAESQTHAGVIDRMIENNDDLSAEAYFKANKERIKGDYLLKAEQAVEAGSLRGKSQRAVDDYMGKGLSMGASMKEAAKIENPKLREATEQRIQYAFTMQERAKRDQEEKNFEWAAKQVDDGKEINEAWISRNLSPQQKQALTNYKLGNWKDDGTKFNQFMDLATYPETRDKFIEMNLSNDAGFLGLNRDNQNKLLSVQKSLRGDKYSGKSGGSAATELNIRKEEMDAIKDSYLNVNGGSDAYLNNIKKDKEDWRNYKDSLFQAVTEAKKAKGVKALSREEVNKISEAFGKKYVTDKSSIMSYFDKTSRFYNIASSLSDEQKETYSKLIRESGKPVTNNMITTYHLMAIGQIEKKKAASGAKLNNDARKAIGLDNMGTTEPMMTPIKGK